MRIIDDDTGRELNRITVSLSANELAHLRGAAEYLSTERDEHEHIPSDDWSREITLVTSLE